MLHFLNLINCNVIPKRKSLFLGDTYFKYLGMKGYDVCNYLKWFPKNVYVFTCTEKSNDKMLTDGLDEDYSVHSYYS